MRKIIGLTAVLLLVLMAVFPALAEGGVTFVQGEPHTYTTDFRLYFDTMTAQTGRCTISIQKQIFTEELAADIVSTVSADMDKLQMLLGGEASALGECILYVVDKTPKGIQFFDGRLYCTGEDVLSGKYLAGLTIVLLPGHEIWKSVGLAELVQGRDVDTTALTKELAVLDDLDILSLFAAYFHPDFATEAERQTATKLSVLLCDLVLHQDGAGASALVNTPCYAQRQALLDDLGVARTYADPYQGFDETYTYTSSLWYSFEAANARGDTFFIRPPLYGMETPKKVRRFFYEAAMAPQVILEGIRADAPAFYEEIRQHYQQPIIYRIEPDQKGSFSNYAPPELILRAGGTVVHETAHQLVPVTYHYMRFQPSMWEYEAIAEYLTYTYFTPGEHQEIFYDDLMESTEKKLADTQNQEEYEELSLKAAARKLYFDACGVPASIEDFDAQAYIKARVKAMHQLPYALPFYRRSVNGTYASTGPQARAVASANGNELSYDEAHCFAAYLIGEYGLNEFLRFCMADAPYQYEEIYGLPYETLKQNWLAAE